MYKASTNGGEDDKNAFIVHQLDMTLMFTFTNSDNIAGSMNCTVHLHSLLDL